jgi:zinc protease
LKTLLLTFLLGVPVLAQEPALSTPLPVDTNVKVGTLSNGLRYYIRRNTTPLQRAELRLVVNTGSILEKDNQLGYAHFIEHMAFNGTTHFAKNDLISYLQSVGVRFGADLNASTSFDETEYILPVPTANPKVVDQAFTILEDWAHGLLFDSAEVVAERGVVREEWRGGRGAGERMLEQWFPKIFRNSMYARRLPIGTEASIMSATPSELRAFYKEWYRPDLMAVVAVGDFNPADIEAEIKKHFAAIPATPNPSPRTTATVSPDTAAIVAIATDKEATSTRVSLMFQQPRAPTATVGDYRRDLVGSLVLQMLNARLGEIAQKPTAPFLDARASRGGFLARNVVRFSLDARVRDGEEEKGLEAIVTEVRRAQQFGFLQAELDRARANMIRDFEHQNAEREKSQSAMYAEEYVRNFLQAEPFPGIVAESRLANQLLPDVTLAEINGTIASWINGTSPVVLVQAPQRPGISVATESRLQSALDRASKTSIAAYSESSTSGDLIASLRPSGKIVSSRSIQGAGITEWKLSNGARVLVKPTDFKSDEILLGGYSPGGTSLASDKDFVSAVFAAQIAGVSGLGSFSRPDLIRKLSGKSVALTSSVAETLEELAGRTTPNDLETLLQILYLQFTGTRFDSAAVAAFQSNMASIAADRGASPDEVFRDTMQVTMSQHDIRSRPLTTQLLAEVNPQKSLQFFRDRYSNARGYAFVFVGNVDTATLRPLVERYIASLPSAAKLDSARNVTHGYPRGVVERTVRKGLEPKASTVITFTGPCAYTAQSRFAIRSVVAVLQQRLNESLREKLGKTYSPGVRGSCGNEPRQEYAISILFSSAPADAEVLTKTVFALIDTLKTKGPTSDEIEKVREQMIRAREVDQRQNTFWLSNILIRDHTRESLSDFTGEFDRLVKGLNSRMVMAAAKKYFDFKNYARFVLLPESP